MKTGKIMKKYFNVVAGALLLLASATACGGGKSETAARQGNQGARPVEILKYSDYSCPYCKTTISMDDQLKSEFGELVTIEYRYFPLDGFQFSDLAARSVESAARQGKKWEMHDKIFEGQEIWTRGNADEIFRGYAEEIGLDLEQFESDLNSEEVRQEVQRQKNEGIRRMVRATPTYFLNGQRLQQLPQTYGQFRSLVEMYMYQ